VRVAAVRGDRIGSGPFGETVPEEVPLALVINHLPHAVMLATPADVEDFALGFLLTEGLLADARELHALEVTRSEEGISLHLRVAGPAFAGLKERRRNLTGRTGCGLCGIEDLAQVQRVLPRVGAAPPVAASALRRAAEELQQCQPFHAATGGVHAAAWSDIGGHILCVREDIGRHNALDKLVGALARQQTDFAAGFALITSRASFEMVQKSATVGIRLLAAISAPTGMAIRTAERCGLTLAAFVRGDRYTLYSHPQRVLHEDAGEPSNGAKTAD
jgi:formate dehydrogenase accessory protein FdhD